MLESICPLTNRKWRNKAFRIIAPKAPRMRLSVVLFFVPTDVHVATIGLMTALMPPDHGGAG
ncbi:hypothetical protein BAE39_30815 [Mesorhizobium loti]|uniref:Uncharacterized protein n=1 Tax=Rhizobium loti TaxID=381 RepID=A0A1A5IGG4_RHILI|nr:hypothetical protein BAE39_30815 [Mesorhizobium loti]OBQ69826.1 hypothetical protein A8145_28930 [Mesorhizobium loti]